MWRSKGGGLKKKTVKPTATTKVKAKPGVKPKVGALKKNKAMDVTKQERENIFNIYRESDSKGNFLESEGIEKLC
jgi:hypothetical protein